MENLQNELAALKNSLEAMAVINGNLKNSLDIVSLKLQELQDRQSPKINAEDLSQWIEDSFQNVSPSYVSMDWSDGGFTASYEVDFVEFVYEELGSRWTERIAEFIIDKITPEK